MDAMTIGQHSQLLQFFERFQSRHRPAHELMQQGAKGIVYGRNVIQHDNPRGMTRALMAIVHDGATPEQALTHLGA